MSKPSVSAAVKKLRNERLLIVDGEHNLILTDEGFKYAITIFERHITIEKFLIDVLGVGKEAAHCDACRLEHFVSPETFKKIKEIYDKN